MLHIIYRTIDQNSVTSIIEEDEKLRGSVFFLHDDYSIGQLFQDDKSQSPRVDFWCKLLEQIGMNENAENPAKKDKETFQQLKQHIAKYPNEKICFWLGENALDLTAYMFAFATLKLYGENIYQIYVENLPFFSEAGRILFPKRLSEITQRAELKKCTHLLRKISATEMEMDKQTWQEACDAQSELRKLSGHKLFTPQTYAESVDCLIKQYMRMQKRSILVDTLVQHLQKTVAWHREFLLWRVQSLLSENALTEDITKKKASSLASIKIKPITSDSQSMT